MTGPRQRIIKRTGAGVAEFAKLALSESLFQIANESQLAYVIKENDGFSYPYLSAIGTPISRGQIALTTSDDYNQRLASARREIAKTRKATLPEYANVPMSRVANVTADNYGTVSDIMGLWYNEATMRPEVRGMHMGHSAAE